MRTSMSSEKDECPLFFPFSSLPTSFDSWTASGASFASRAFCAGVAGRALLGLVRRLRYPKSAPNRTAAGKVGVQNVWAGGTATTCRYPVQRGSQVDSAPR